MDCSLPGSSVHGISQARIPEWVAISFSRGSSKPRDQTHISFIGRHRLPHWATWIPRSIHAYLLCCAMLCSFVSDSCYPMDCGPPHSSVHGISQARILEWVAISFSRDIPDPGIEPTSPALAGRFFTTSTTLQCLTRCPLSGWKYTFLKHLVPGCQEVCILFPPSVVIGIKCTFSCGAWLVMSLRFWRICLPIR